MNVLAGMKGFEPLNVGSKFRCLTTWLHPIHFEITISSFFVNEKRRKKKKKEENPKKISTYTSPSWNRTNDKMVNSHLLYL